MNVELTADQRSFVQKAIESGRFTREEEAIEEALGRIDKGTYGVCRDCGEPIAPARLNAIPWTRVCITCKEKQNL